MTRHPSDSLHHAAPTWKMDIALCQREQLHIVMSACVTRPLRFGFRITPQLDEPRLHPAKLVAIAGEAAARTHDVRLRIGKEISMHDARSVPAIGVISHPTFPPETLGDFARRAESDGFDAL